jgi:benzoyl-CoA reductase subunit BamC
MCEDIPPLSAPMCVQACKFDALTYEERVEEVKDDGATEEMNPLELKMAYESLVKKHGSKKLMDTFERFSKR